MAINCRAVFVGAKEAMRHMSDGGRIITIGSVNADRMPFAGGSVYAMSKAAVAGSTRGLARDLGPRRITVNAVQPGPINTDLNPANGPFAETLNGFMALTRYGEGEEIAALVAYSGGVRGGVRHGSVDHDRWRLRGVTSVSGRDCARWRDESEFGIAVGIR